MSFWKDPYSRHLTDRKREKTLKARREFVANAEQMLAAQNPNATQKELRAEAMRLWKESRKKGKA